VHAENGLDKTRRWVSGPQSLKQVSLSVGGSLSDGTRMILRTHLGAFVLQALGSRGSAQRPRHRRHGRNAPENGRWDHAAGKLRRDDGGSVSQQRSSPRSRFHVAGWGGSEGLRSSSRTGLGSSTPRQTAGKRRTAAGRKRSCPRKTGKRGRPKGSKLSAEARRRISEAQKACWEKIRDGKKK
jgi:hypothetical protein